MSTVLIVDDDLTNRTMFGLMLEHEGYQVLLAGDAPSALALLEGGARPGLILLDLMMPGMTGWDFRQIQLQNPNLAHIPVVVLSAMNDLVGRSDGLEAAEVIQKPVTISTLLDVVGRHCLPE
jgi:CheY-like chemotaxis protein